MKTGEVILDTQLFISSIHHKYTVFYLAYSGDRTTVPSLLMRALYRATTEQSKRSVEYPVIFKAPLTPTGLGDIGLNARATVRRKGIQTRPFYGIFILNPIVVWT